MESTHSILVNRFFARNTFSQLIDEGRSSTYTAVVRRYVNDPENKTNMKCISEIYQFLKKQYQNEYYYKNTLLNKLLLGVHSLRTTTALTELPVGNSKADFILINGKAVVYEIKTALDNFERLESQIDDYYKAFSRVMVVVSEEHYDEAQNKLFNTPVGICLLTKKGTLSIRKEPIEYCEKISKTIMFKMLRKNEYEKIILESFGELPKVSQFEYYRVCRSLFESLETEEAHQLFIKALKSRTKINIEEYSKVPYELKFLVYFSNYKKKDYEKLECFLKVQGG